MADRIDDMRTKSIDVAGVRNSVRGGTGSRTTADRTTGTRTASTGSTNGTRKNTAKATGTATSGSKAGKNAGKGKKGSTKRKGKKKLTAKKRRRKIIRRVILMIFGVLFAVGMIIFGPTLVKIVKLQQAAKELVDNSSKDTFMATQNTVIYDNDGNELCTMRDSKDLYYVEYNDIPTDIVNAFIVMEDKKFYEHGGIDIKGIMRAIIANQKSNKISQGASTITQQLARNIFLSTEQTWERKVEEMFIAMGMEKKYTKQEILEFYLNNIYFANGYYGVEAAARGYFNKSVGDLTLAQQAFIAAIPNSPSRYNPLENFDATQTRQQLILKTMYDNDIINTGEYYAALDEEIVLDQPEKSNNNSVETYVRRCATESMMQAYGFEFRYTFDSEDDYNTYKDNYDSVYTLYQQKLLSGGYSVYTSINMDIQNQLQSSIDNNLAKYTTMSDDGIYEMQGAATCIDNTTGNVVAIVGGRSQELSGYTLNRAFQSYRQPGSSIKPLSVYTPYLQLGNTPDTIVVDEAIEGGPKNADNTYAGSMTLRDAVKLSKNTVAWKVYEQITPQAGSSFLMNMMFKKIWPDKDLIAPALGGFTYGVTTEEMAGGYAAIANDGVFRKPTCITTIKNADGKKIVDETSRGTRVYESKAARMMIDMMKTVVESGTGTAAKTSNAIVAGKTGTTNSNKDSWFVGFSKYYTTSVWMGYDMPKEMTSPGKVTCAIWKDFMESIHTGLELADFPTYTTSSQETQTEAETTAPQEVETETQTTAIQPSTAAKGDQDANTNGLGDQDANQLPAGGDKNSNSNNGYSSNNEKPAETQSAAQKQTAAAGDQDSHLQGGDQDANLSGDN